VTCISCGDEILPERAELGFTYCTKRQCVRENAKGMTVVEIAQNKTNAEYVILEGEAGTASSTICGKASTAEIPWWSSEKVERRSSTFPRLSSCGPEDILDKGAYMNLTRSEVVRYMTARRGGHR
jgi:hypothetical protein